MRKYMTICQRCGQQYYKVVDLPDVQPNSGDEEKEGRSNYDEYILRDCTEHD